VGREKNVVISFHPTLSIHRSCDYLLGKNVLICPIYVKGVDTR
jgi:hypothetical protein